MGPKFATLAPQPPCPFRHTALTPSALASDSSWLYLSRPFPLSEMFLTSTQKRFTPSLHLNLCLNVSFSLLHSLHPEQYLRHVEDTQKNIFEHILKRGASLVAERVKRLPAMQEIQV